MPDARVQAAKTLLLSSSFFNIYVIEAHWLLATISRRIDTALGTLPSLPSEGGMLVVRPEFHDDVDAALVSAVRLRRLIDVPTAPALREKDKHFSMRKARSQLFVDFFQGLDLSELYRSGVRDTIEHMDEKLDQLAVKLLPPPAKANAYAIHNLVISGQEIFEILNFHGCQRYTFRMYSQRDGEYFHGHERINLVRLGTQARAAFDRLDAWIRKSTADDSDDTRGAQIPFFAIKQP
jgi:hypothetical protein